MKTGIELINEERARQIMGGKTLSLDLLHKRGELIDAALSYIFAAINAGHPAMQPPPKEWPWNNEMWKPSYHPVQNLIKAGALIAAEIDRVQRVNAIHETAGVLRRNCFSEADYALALNLCAAAGLDPRHADRSSESQVTINDMMAKLGTRLPPIPEEIAKELATTTIYSLETIQAAFR